MDHAQQQQTFRNYVLNKNNSTSSNQKNTKIPPADLILIQAIKNYYSQAILKEVIEVDRFNDFLTKGDQLCFKMCYTDVYDSQDLRSDLKEIYADQLVCHSNCLDKLKFSKEIMLNNLKDNSQFQAKVLRFHNHPDIKKLNEYEVLLKKSSGIDDSMLEKIKSLV